MGDGQGRRLAALFPYGLGVDAVKAVLRRPQFIVDDFDVGPFSLAKAVPKALNRASLAAKMPARDSVRHDVPFWQ